jgi:hypothetical protein
MKLPLSSLKKIMKKNEIVGFIEDKFKKIARQFQKAIVNFEPEDIYKFRAEIKKLKVFFHLLSMESRDGLSYRITKKMKTIYGYFGIIQNVQQQLKKINEYVKESAASIPVSYVNMLEKELDYWKKLSKDFIDADYDFDNDKEEILVALTDKLTKRSIKKFIDYICYELNTISGRLDEDEALDNIRKFMEDIYYNYEVIASFMNQQQMNLFNQKSIAECLKFFDDFHDKCVALALLKTFDTNGLNEPEKQLLKEMENEWMYKKKDVKNKLITTLRSMNIPVNKMEDFAIAGIIRE